MGRNVHVVPDGGSWPVKLEGESRPYAHYQTQAEAIDAGTGRAKLERSELLIHGRAGRIRERNSFGGDPYPPRG